MCVCVFSFRPPMLSTFILLYSVRVAAGSPGRWRFLSGGHRLPLLLSSSSYRCSHRRRRQVLCPYCCTAAGSSDRSLSFGWSLTFPVIIIQIDVAIRKRSRVVPSEPVTSGNEYDGYKLLYYTDQVNRIEETSVLRKRVYEIFYSSRPTSRSVVLQRYV